MVHGNTVAAMGPHKGLKQVRKLVEDCMHNFHPVYHIKAMMIRRELEKDPNLSSESWERFLPQFKKTNNQRPKALDKRRKAKPEYTPFPPAPTPSPATWDDKNTSHHTSSKSPLRPGASQGFGDDEKCNTRISPTASQ